jgi:hypothetical protein
MVAQASSLRIFHKLIRRGPTLHVGWALPTISLKNSGRGKQNIDRFGQHLAVFQALGQDPQGLGLGQGFLAGRRLAGC